VLKRIVFSFSLQNINLKKYTIKGFKGKVNKIIDFSDTEVMKYLNILIILFIFTPCILFAELVPKGSVAYFQMKSLIKIANIKELDKFIGVDSKLTKEEMAEIVAKILINNSYLDMETKEENRKPVFYPLRSELSNLKDITLYLKDELSEYGIDHEYLVESFNKLEKFILNDKKEILDETNIKQEIQTKEVVAKEDTTLKDAKDIDESQKFIEREILKIRDEESVRPKELYSPSHSFREVSLYSADIPDKKWAVESALSIHKSDSSSSDSLSKALDYLGVVYSPTPYTTTYAYYDDTDLQKDGFYGYHSSIKLGLKTLINRFARNYAKFCIGLETQQYYGSYSKNKSRVYLASAFKLRSWETTQIINNMSFYKVDGENKFVNSFGIENKFPFLPLYWIFELNEDFSGKYNVRNYAIRTKRKHLNYDLIYEDNNHLDRQRIKINCFWTF